MPTIILKTSIQAPIQRVFDLSRSIDLHLQAASKYRESVVDGRSTGLVELHDTVTWRAVHFGISWEMKVQVTELSSPTRFVDEMIHGPFAYMRHIHEFVQESSSVCMIDIFDYKAPFGWLGSLTEYSVLSRHMKRFLLERNHVIKSMAESDSWKHILEANE